MKLSKKQREDLESCLYFVPMGCRHWVKGITDEDIASYFAWSDKGDKTFLNRSNWTFGGENLSQTRGATAIKYGKTYRELFITDMLRDLDDFVYIWDIARDEPDMPEKVLAALGGNRIEQFRFWRDKFTEDPDCNPMDVLSQKIKEIANSE